MPLPESIKNAPILSLGLELFFLAFKDLSWDRHTEGGSIPWTAVQRYAEVQGWDEDTTYEAHYLISEMDDTLHNFRKKKG